MNQIVTRSEAKPALSAGGSISSIVPRNLDEAFRLSQAIHQAGMSPYGIDTPQKVMIAMLAGLELGMPPMQAVQSVAVINNRPCMWGDGLIGVVRRDPSCLYVKEWMEGTGDARIAYCETKRRGEDEPVVRSFSVDDAKRAGLWQTEPIVKKRAKGGGTYEGPNDSPWYKYPQRMLQMRARAWCLRDVYPDVLKGMHSREEVEDYAHAEPVEVQPYLPPLEERLRIARQDQPEERQESREGFDADFVARETAGLTSGSEIGQEPSDTASPQQSDAGDDTDPPAGVVADLSADEAEKEDGAEETSPADPAPSSILSDEDREWLITAARILVPCAEPNSDPDVVRKQYGTLIKTMTPATISQLAISKAVSISKHLVEVCESTAELNLDLVAGIAGCEPASLKGAGRA